MSENLSDGAATLFFSSWYVEVNNRKDLTVDFDKIAANKESDDNAKTILKVHQDTGANFPSFDNFKDTITLCDQFLGEKVDTDLLQKVKKRADEDFAAIKPFIAAFKHLDTGGGFGMPMIVMVFGYPKSLATFIEEHTDSTGSVIGLKRTDFEGIKKMVRDKFSILQKPVGIQPAARAESPPSPPPA